MRRLLTALLFALTLCTGVAIAADEPCAIRHCPKGTACRPAPSPCPTVAPVPAPAPVVVEKIVQAPAPAPEIRYVPQVVVLPGKTETITRVVPDQRHGLMLPISAFKVGRIEGLAVGLGYQFRNRMILSGQIVGANSEEISTFTRINNTTTLVDSDGDGTVNDLPRHCTDGHGRDGEQNPHCQGGDDDDDPTPTYRRRVTSSSSSDHDRHLGAMVTLTIPLGRR